jgi:tRNA threonylcarbamoyladenosine biosynthesis protein TsaB
MPPTILALDTSTDACSVALGHAGRVHVDHRVAARAHARTLLPMIDGVLAAAGVGPGDLDAVAFGRGPGSFTGLRIAASVTQGLAWAREVPVIGLSSLELIARSALAEGETADVIATVVDARMDELYLALFRVEGGEPVALGDDRLLAPAAAAEALAARPAGTLLLLGDGIECLPPGAVPDDARIHADVLPRAETALDVAARRLVAGEGRPAAEAHPVYLRDEGRWKRMDPAPKPAS